MPSIVLLVPTVHGHSVRVVEEDFAKEVAMELTSSRYEECNHMKRMIRIWGKEVGTVRK